jgi:hypothetical protein
MATDRLESSLTTIFSEERRVIYHELLVSALKLHWGAYTTPDANVIRFMQRIKDQLGEPESWQAQDTNAIMHIADLDGNNILHHLAGQHNKMLVQKARKFFVELPELMVMKNNQGLTPLDKLLQKGLHSFVPAAAIVPEAFYPLAENVQEALIQGVKFTHNPMLHQTLVNLYAVTIGPEASLAPYINHKYPLLFMTFDSCMKNNIGGNYADGGDVYIEGLPSELRQQVENNVFFAPLVSAYIEKSITRMVKQLVDSFAFDTSEVTLIHDLLVRLYESEATPPAYAHVQEQLIKLFASSIRIHSPSALEKFITQATPTQLYVKMHQAVQLLIEYDTLTEFSVLSGRHMEKTVRDLPIFRGFGVGDKFSFVENLFLYGHTAVANGGKSIFPIYKQSSFTSHFPTPDCLANNNEGVTSWSAVPAATLRFTKAYTGSYDYSQLIIEAILPVGTRVFMNNNFKWEYEVGMPFVDPSWIRAVYVLNPASDSEIAEIILNPGYQGTDDIPLLGTVGSNIRNISQTKYKDDALESVTIVSCPTEFMPFLEYCHAKLPTYRNEYTDLNVCYNTLQDVNALHDCRHAYQEFLEG